MDYSNKPKPTKLSEVLHFFGLCLVAFIGLTGYEMARPATQSLFVDIHGHDGLLWVWPAVALFTLIAVFFYNRFAVSFPLHKIFIVIKLISSIILILCILFYKDYSKSISFILYIWRDVYVVFLIEMFWSYANSIYNISSARWRYGVYLVAGSLGAILGGTIIGDIAKHYGSLNSLWFLIPIFFTSALLFTLLTIARPTSLAKLNKKSIDFFSGFKLLKTSVNIRLLVILIAAIQVTITIVNYRFNGFMELDFPDQDIRTAEFGSVYRYTNMVAITLQMIAGVLLKYIGFRIVFLAIPIFLSSAFVVFALNPTLTTIRFTQIIAKGMDYSIFRAAKELLYIPLTYQEQTQGKALVDVLTYRAAKVITSGFILVLLQVKMIDGLTFLTLLCIGIWAFIAFRIVKLYHRHYNLT